MKRFVVFLFIFLPVFLSAQTAAEVESILSTQAINFTQASRFVLAVADVIDETAETGTAYALAREQRWLPRGASPDNPIKLGELCFLIMKAFNMKGSFLNAVFPGPHYAFRELNYLKLIPGQRDPGVRVSGERLLQILGMIAAYTRADQKAPGEVPVPEEAVVAEAPEETPVPEETAAAVVMEAPGEVPAPEEAAVAEAPEETPVSEETVAAVVMEAPKETFAPGEAAAEKAPAAEKVGAVKLNNIQFRPNSARLMETEKAKLRDMAAVLSEYPDGKVLVGGYTAMAGSEYGRRRISTQRAQAVADFLISLKIRPAKDIIVRGYGSRRLLTSSAAKENLVINRRVEITFLNEDYFRIQFMPDSAALMETEKAKLRELAAVLSRYPDVKLLVAGYTTTEGAEANRVRISTERARAVADFLRLSGFRSGTITVRGYGAARPLGDNATPEGKAINRRVEIILQDRDAR